MEWTIRILNLLSAVLLLVTGIYVQVGFAVILSPAVRMLIVAGALLYFLLRLDQFMPSERDISPSVER
ncbi:MAG: hypothetical protein KOO62_07080 [candidate division Zixibacteria bacterium]|nr:hypothetical protein [candidate division Zixibacteria bacterium]